MYLSYCGVIRGCDIDRRKIYVYFPALTTRHKQSNESTLGFRYANKI